MAIVMTWIIGWSALSADLQVSQLICQRTGQLFAGTSTGWKNGMMGTSKSCTWNRRTPSTQAAVDWLQSSFSVMDLGVLVDTKANMDQQCGLVVKKANLYCSVSARV